MKTIRLLCVFVGLGLVGCGAGLVPDVAPVPTTLKMTNARTSDIYYASGFWFQVKDGPSDLMIRASCPNECSADACVGCAADALAPIVKRLGPGESVEYAWDGRFWAVTGENMCGQCLSRDKITARDLVLQATFGNDARYDNVSAEIGAPIDLGTVTATFRVGVDAVAAVEVRDGI